MGSLNGDVLVMRNGRSTSQVSVYNYPEHLNPFYEDDQHKRLRFWKISKKDDGRRNSFSISNLKDMWAFKSFRMKKKSSTLGINKTSESPPMLRRNYVVDNGYNTFDHRLRSNNTSSINDDSFQRNASYRSSLQTLPTNNDRMGLNRNDGYRSTIQVTRSNPRYQPKPPQTTGVSQQRRYVYGGSVTPQPLRNSNVHRGSYEYDSDSNLIRGSSQSSMVSTNPFDTDNEDDNEDINVSDLKSVNGGSTSTLSSRTPRKKRRAPAPPTPIHGRSNGVGPPPTIIIESSQDNAQDELRIREDMDIANLTAEIQSFVKTKDNDDVKTTEENEIKPTSTVIISTEEVKEKVIKPNEVPTATSTVKTSTDEEVEKVIKSKEAATPKDSNTTTTVSTVTDTKVSNKKLEEEIKVTPAKRNGQVTTEIITVTTTKTVNATDANKSLERKPSITKVTNEIVTKTTNESKEMKSNGAIPKKPNNSEVSSSMQQQQQSHVEDLCIKETNKVDVEQIPQKPVPVKRQTKPETEVGHVECIHVHVESPRSTPCRDQTSGLSSFKTEQVHESNEKITTKTPFVLTSPPTQRRQIPLSNEEESVRILHDTKHNERINELNITENRVQTKPEILVKPTLSPKPVTEPNGRVHTFAEIHKPTRSKITNTQNGHIRRASRDEIVSPPIVPIQKPKEVEEQKEVTKVENKLTNLQPIEINLQTEKKIEYNTEVLNKTADNLKIEESATNNTKDEPKVTNSSSDSSNKRSDVIDNFEFESLYRPKPSTHMEWKRSTLAPLETHIPPEKRKSVKDIIESINRSQRLLHASANKDFTVVTTTTTTTAASNETSAPSIKPVEINHNNNHNNIEENLHDLEESEREFQRLIDEMEPGPSNGNVSAHQAGASSSNSNNEYLEAHKLDNDIFQKCKVKKEVYDYRESSPISSNLDWNPVPKPKRTKPLHE